MSSPMSPPASNIITQELSGAQVDTLLAKLISLLPYPIPLTRRLQYHQRQPSSTAHILLAYFPHSLPPNAKHVLGDNPNADENEIAHLIPPPHATWLAAHVDLATPGETQAWLFASWELPSSQPDAAIEQNLVYALFSHLYHNLVPAQSTEPTADWLLLKHTGKYLSQPYCRNKVLFGSVHEKVYQYFPQAAITRIDPSYGKYIFEYSTPLIPPVGFPDGYALGDMTDDLLQTVVDSSPIPRTLKTLKSLPNVGLYHGHRLIAWAFLGKDYSVCSVHTEPEYRGRGFAVALARELMHRQAQILGDGPVAYAHADVSVSNAASNSVMKKLQGQVMWEIAWIELDLETALHTTNTIPHTTNTISRSTDHDV
ncbi:hypothetical protein DV737_g1964, partial [Chaetothyriales sp. CBS 132003]